MRIGIVGYGSIAKKVYLPLYLEKFKFTHISIYSRNIEKLKKETYFYNFNLYSDINLMIKEIDCLMVHSTTVSHYDYIKLAIDNKIPVYVDKPLTHKLDLSKDLIKLAKDKSTLVFVGYNRRYAPLYLKLKEMDLSINRIHYEKHRQDLTYNEAFQTAIIDDFIHLVDSVNDIVDKPLNLKDLLIKTSNNLELESLYVDFSNKDKVITTFMARNSGSDLERLSIEAKNCLITIDNMREMTIIENNKTEVIRVNQRSSDSEIRGFLTSLETFFTLVKDNKYYNLRQYESEELCESIIKKIGK